MLTCSRLHRLWRDDKHRRLIRALAAGRPDAALRLDERIPGPIAAAALLHLRLAELNQSSTVFARELLRRLLMSQRTDGSWHEVCERGDAGGLSDAARQVMRTALVARALAEYSAPLPACPPARLGLSGIDRDVPAGSHRATQEAIARAVRFLADQQGPDGAWPLGGGDSWEQLLVTGFVVLQLGRLGQFREAIRVGEALAVTTRRGLRTTGNDADGELRGLWEAVENRCGPLLRRESARAAQVVGWALPGAA